MPIWNTREDHLREAMESILNQTFSDFEYLILNDLPDNTKLDEIVASYNDPRIRYARNEQNVGITPSRNKLLQMAEGEYIAIFDHDDISEPTRLEKQVAYLEKPALSPVMNQHQCMKQSLPENAEDSFYQSISGLRHSKQLSGYFRCGQ